MLTLMMIPCLGFSQTIPRLEGNWNYGAIITHKGDTLKGFIDFQSKNKELRFHNDELIRVFYPTQVQSFQYFDEFLKMQRYFACYTVSYHNFKQKKLYEKLVFGKYQILRKVNVESTSSYERIGVNHYTTISRFYFWDGKQVTRIKNFTKQFENIFAKHQIDLRRLIKKNNWTTYKVADLIKLVSYLNLGTEIIKVCYLLQIYFLYQFKKN